MTNNSKNIIHYIKDNVAYIILNNPKKLNAINFEMWLNIGKILEEYEINKSVRCIVLKGEGSKAFSAGADISEFDDYILYSEEDLNRWGLPNKELIRTCNDINVDAVLDLNQEFSSASATLTRAVSSPLKLGFYSEEGEKFYNIMVRRKGEELAESGFKEIFQILGIE